MKKSFRPGGLWITLLVLLLVLLLAGCALTEEQKAELYAANQVKPDITLIKGEPVAPESRLPLQLALLVQPSVPGALATLPDSPGAWMVRKHESPLAWRVQAASIVEGALVKALGEATQGDLRSVSSMPQQGNRFDATLELVSVRFDYDERMLWLVPIPIPFLGGIVVGSFEASMRLTAQVRLVDAQGRHVWTKYYDDGTRHAVWNYPGDVNWIPGIQRATHEAAWRVSQQVVEDLRAWLAAELSRPRNL